jgi:hypothetical protein
MDPETMRRLRKHVITKAIAETTDYVAEPPEPPDEAFTDDAGNNDAAEFVDLAAIFDRRPL